MSSAPDLLIRHAEPGDLPQLHALYAERDAFANTLQLPYQPVSRWAHRLDRPGDGNTCLVALRADEIVGQLGIEARDNPRRRHVATLGMGVKATARRTGVGSALLVAAIDTCEHWMNVSRIELEVYADNAAGIALYEKHGFVREGLCRNYAFRDGRYVDALIMARLRP